MGALVCSAFAFLSAAFVYGTRASSKHPSHGFHVALDFIAVADRSFIHLHTSIKKKKHKQATCILNDVTAIVQAKQQRTAGLIWMSSRSSDGVNLDARESKNCA